METSTVRVETSAATAETAPVSQLFLCYAREDAAFCDALVAELRRNGISVRWDRNLSPALDYADQIRALIRSSDAFAVILSKASAASFECVSEIRYAADLGKRLIPVLKDPDFAPDTLPDSVRKIQWCVCSPEQALDAAAAQIRDALQTSAELIPMHTRLLNRSQEWEDSSRDPNLLLRDPALKDAESWLLAASRTQALPQPIALQREYLYFSRRESVRVARRFRVGASIVIAVLVAATSVALYFSQQSDDSAREADLKTLLATLEAMIADREAQRANENAKQSERHAEDSNWHAEQSDRNAAVANERARTLLEERGRQELLSGRWASAALLLAEAYRSGTDTPSLRLMLAASRMPLEGVAAVLHGGDAPITCAELSNDGRRLIAGGTDGIARVWDIRSSRLLAALGPHEGPIDETYLNADGTRALVIALPSRVEDDIDQIGLVVHEPYTTLWNVLSSQQIPLNHWGLDREYHKSRPPPRIGIREGGATFVMFGEEDEEFSFADGRRVAARAPTTTTGLRMRRRVNGDGSASPHGSQYHQNARVLLADGSTVVTTGAENQVVVWKAPPRSQLIATREASKGMMAFRQTSSDLIVVSADGAVSQVRTAEPGQSTSVPTGREPLGLSANGRWLLGRRGSTVELLDVDRLTGALGGTVVDELGSISNHRFSRSGRHLLTWTETASKNDRTLTVDFRLHATPAGKAGGNDVVYATAPVAVAAVSDVPRTFMAESPGRAWIWRGPLLFEHRQEANSNYVEFSPDGQYLASALDDGGILVRNLGAVEASGGRDVIAATALHSHGAGVTHLDFDPAGMRLASASDDGTAKLWDLRSSKLMSTCAGHVGAVRFVRFSADGTLLASAGADKTARVWEVPSCRELLRFGGHSSEVTAAIFDPRGRRLATTDSTTVRIWDLPRETRSADEMAELVTKFTPFCLTEGKLGKWLPPAAGADRGPCLVQ